MNNLLSVKQAAHKFNVHPNTIFKWLRAGKLKGYKVGGQWRIYLEDLEAFMKCNSTETGVMSP